MGRFFCGKNGGRRIRSAESRELIVDSGNAKVFNQNIGNVW